MMAFSLFFYKSTGKHKSQLLESTKVPSASTSDSTNMVTQCVTPSGMVSIKVSTAVKLLEPMYTCSDIHNELSVVSISSDCYPFNSTDMASFTSSDRQTNNETSSDSLCETEVNNATSSEEIPQKSKVDEDQ